MTTRLLLTCAAIGVAGGLANIGNAFLFNLLVVAAPMLLGLAAGVYFLPGVIALAALRRGGVGLLTSVIAGVVQAPFVPTGIASVVVFVILGVLMELPFAVAGYRYWRPWLFAVTAVWTGVVYGVFWFFGFLTEYALVVQVVTPVLLVAVLLATTWLARVIARRLTRIGVLRGVQLPEDRRRAATARASDAASADPAG